MTTWTHEGGWGEADEITGDVVHQMYPDREQRPVPMYTWHASPQDPRSIETQGLLADNPFLSHGDLNGEKPPAGVYVTDNLDHARGWHDGPSTLYRVRMDPAWEVAPDYNAPGAWRINHDVPASHIEPVHSIHHDSDYATVPQPTYALPPVRSRLGAVEASWEEIDPGVALIRVEGGSVDDRTLVRDLLRVQLAHHGIEHGQFFLGQDDEFRKTAHWRDLMAKAKRLIDSGQVQLLRNSRNVVVAHVIGDHGEYNCEFSRDDPDSWSITGWDCECPWSQYAWQRTRQWKKYEGRVCSHVLASFWYARRHPMDEDIAPGGAPMPNGMKGPTPPPSAPGQQQQLFGPDTGQGQFTQMGQPSPDAMPGTMPGGETMPSTGAPAPPPGQDIIPQQPLFEPLPPYVPGSTPNGMQAPPNAFSVPGARPPSPANPGQYPGDGTGTGGTFSKVTHAPSQPPHYRVQTDPGTEKCSTCVMFDKGKCWGYGNTPVAEDGKCDSFYRDGRKTAAQADFENGMKVKLLESEWGIAEGKSDAHGAGEYRQVPQGTHGEVMGQDATTGWVEVIFPCDTSGPMEPYHVRSFLEPKQLQIVAYSPGSPFIKRVGPHSD